MAHHMDHIVNGLVSRMVQRHQIPVPLEHIQSGFAIITDMRADQTMPRLSAGFKRPAVSSSAA